MRNEPQHWQEGYILLLTMFFISIASMLVTVLLGRSMTESQAATRFVKVQRAFHWAEAGLDDALWEFNKSLGDFAEEEGWTTGLPCPAGHVCRTLLSSLTEGAAVDITVENPGAALSTIDVVATRGDTTTRLRVAVQKVQKLPVSATATVIGEDDAAAIPAFFEVNLLNSLQISGCDRDSSQCLPGLTVTTAAERDAFVAYADTAEAGTNPLISPFGPRLVGAASDYQGAGPPYTDYSMHYAPQDLANGGMGYAMMNSLAAYAKTKAQEVDEYGNDCYFDTSNDDTTANDDPSSLEGLRLFNRNGVSQDANGNPIPPLGTVAQPRICYAEAPFGVNGDGTYVWPDANSADMREEVHFKGTIKGAGILVVRGEIDASKSGTFEYEGIIISLGPSGELHFKGNTTVRGAMMVSTSERAFNPTTGQLEYVQPEYEPVGGPANLLQPDIQYSSQAVARAQALLAGWAPPSPGPVSPDATVKIVVWQECPPLGCPTP